MNRNIKRSFKVSISSEELAALYSMVDLAGQTVADASNDWIDQTGRTRRNGGYAGDERRATKFLYRATLAESKFKGVKDEK